MIAASEPLESMFSSSRLLILDFKQIAKNTPEDESIEKYFSDCMKKGIDPKLPTNRQKFNNSLIQKFKVRYLVSRYGEDRSAMLKGSAIDSEGRTLHLGIDVFSQNIESVYAPFDGQIVRVGNEPEMHSFGHFLILKPDSPDIPSIFFGHLSSAEVQLRSVKAGDKIAQIGNFANNENGYWSRHLHIQMLKNLPDNDEVPLGYSTRANFPLNSDKYPDPSVYFPLWKY